MKPIDIIFSIIILLFGGAFAYFGEILNAEKNREDEDNKTRCNRRK